MNAQFVEEPWFFLLVIGAVGTAAVYLFAGAVWLVHTIHEAWGTLAAVWAVILLVVMTASLFSARRLEHQ